MSANRRFRIFVAALAVSSLAPGCRTTKAAEAQTRAEGEATRDRLPRSNIWITFSPGGVSSTTSPRGDGAAIVSVGGLRPPIFSLRMRPIGQDGHVEADVLTPVGFDEHHIRASDIREEGWSRDLYSDLGLREARLELALLHHRPPVRFRVDGMGEPNVRSTPEMSRHEACARRLLRAAIEGQITAAQNEVQRQSQRKRLQKDIAGSVSAPIDQASLLLRLAMLSLPSATYEEDPRLSAATPDPLPDQWNWRSRQIRICGRPVGLRLDLLSDPNSPAASLCRSLTLTNISKPHSDTCTINGVINRRDGWPISIAISRTAEVANGPKATESRNFNRVAPLQGFVPPADPCSADR